MKTFTQFRLEIEGYSDVKKTVEAEEKISIAGTHSLLKKVRFLESYEKELKEIVRRIISFSKEEVFSRERKGEKILFVLGGDRAMVGGLWNRVADYSAKEAKNYDKIFIYGSEVKKSLPKIFFRENKTEFFPISFEENFRENLLNVWKNQKFSKIDIIWPKMVNLAFFKPDKKTIAPFDLGSEIGIFVQEGLSGLPIFEPTKKEVIKEFIGRYLLLVARKTIMESNLAEFLNRATLMEKAKKEVDKIIKTIIHRFRRERRKILTKNQIETFMAHKFIK